MDLFTAVKNSSVFLLDMDGTIYFDDAPIGDMRRTLALLRESGKRIVYLTNNSSKTASEYVGKLKKIGLYGDGDIVYTSGMATAEYIVKNFPDEKVYLVGTEELESEFISYGIRLTVDEPDICVLAYDTSLTFEKLKRINKYIVLGKKYIATHPDDVCPSKDVFPPDVGSFISLLKTSSGREPDIICGKPYSVMGDCIKELLHVSENEIFMVGDRLHTDIRFGVNNGFHTLLVLSGETKANALTLSPDKAEFILPSLNDIVKYL